jgi:hypothetical protein
VVRAYDREVASVDSRDLGDAQAVSRDDDRCIHCAQWQVAVARDQLGDPQPVRDRHRLNGERAAGEVAEEADLGFCAESSRDEVADLGDDQGRDDERAGMGLEQFECDSMVSVVGVDVGVQRSGVDDERGYRATSAARISSMRSATSLRPLCPPPAAPSRRRVDGPPR